MSTVLKTCSGSHYRVYVTVFPLHLAISPNWVFGVRNLEVDSKLTICVVSHAVFDYHHHHSYSGGEYSAQDTLGKPLPGICNGFFVTFDCLAEGALTLAEGAFETPSESRRAGSGCLSIGKLTRHHPVVGHPLIH